MAQPPMSQRTKRDPCRNQNHHENDTYDEGRAIGLEHIGEYVTDREQLYEHPGIRIERRNRLQRPAVHDHQQQDARDKCRQQVHERNCRKYWVHSNKTRS